MVLDRWRQLHGEYVVAGPLVGVQSVIMHRNGSPVRVILRIGASDVLTRVHKLITQCDGFDAVCIGYLGGDGNGFIRHRLPGRVLYLADVRRCVDRKDGCVLGAGRRIS